ncbi:MAG: hypothetical protein ACOVQX_03285 [Legionella sp.]
MFTWVQSASQSKARAYRAGKVAKIHFFEQSHHINGRDGDITTVGFFSPYISMADFRNQLKAPVVMPIICFAEMALNLIAAIKNMLLTVINLMILDFSIAANRFSSSIQALLFAVYFAGTVLFDAAFSLVALMTRTSVSMVAKTLDGICGFINAVNEAADPGYVYDLSPFETNP